LIKPWPKQRPDRLKLARGSSPRQFDYSYSKIS
jgi:hypothetical protein